MQLASVTAPVNIATLKYWGKRDTPLNLPTNSSISVTLSQDDLRTLTSAAVSSDFTGDRLWLNGKEQDLSKNVKLQQCIVDLRQLRKEMEAADASLAPWSQYGIHVVSENNFPTAAGLASSAAGFAALVMAIAKLFQLPQSTSDLSKIARKGSGSACRSLFGGYVAWEMGQLNDGSDSKAVQVAPESHWPDMKAAILVVSDMQKDTPSTAGMQLTVATSDLFQYRIEDVVPKRYNEMLKSIQDRDFPKFAEMTMKDSNSFHSTCSDSFPPIYYMNDTSRKIVRLAHQINDYYNETIVAYTYDAGPNAVLYYLEQNESKILSIIYKIFGRADGWQTKFSDSQLADLANAPQDASFDRYSQDAQLAQNVSRVILTQVGPGPQISKECLIDEKTGLPK